jgi:uncharacterized protein
LAKIICNTSPLQYLHQLGLLHLLQALADEVIVPEAVVQELDMGRMLGVNVPDVTALDWLNVEQPRSVSVLPLVTDLGVGETEVLALALEHPKAIAVLDDKLARTFAQTLGLPFTGTLGLLLDAKSRKLIEEVVPLLDELDGLGFRVSAVTRRTILKLANEVQSDA